MLLSIFAIDVDVAPAVKPTADCPTQLSAAAAEPWNYSPIQAQMETSEIVASNPNPEKNLIESFALANGVVWDGFELPTRIVTMAPNDKGLCWYHGNGPNRNLIRQANCSPGLKDEEFVVKLPPTGTFKRSEIYKRIDDSPYKAWLYNIPPTIGTPIEFIPGTGAPPTPRVFCIYHTTTGSPVFTPELYKDAYISGEGSLNYTGWRR